MPAIPPPAFRIAFVGLSDAERQTVAACLRLLAADRVPRYELVSSIDDADHVIADAEHTPSVKLVLVTERLRRALWVGTPPPMGSAAVVERPIQPAHLLRELDALVAQAGRPRPSKLVAAATPSMAVPPVAASPAPLLAEWDGDNRRRTGALPAEPPLPSALLVDDSEVALRFLETRLQRWGLLTERALSSGRAIEMMARRHYDFVFLDIELGSHSPLDGLALCQHIKRQQDKAPAASTVVLVSAHASEQDRVRGSLAGADAHLGKPLDEVALQRLMLKQGLKARSAGAAPGA